MVVLAHLPGAVATQTELREWWASEADARRRYGLSPEQEAALVEACRLRIPTLLEVAPVTTLPAEPRAIGSFGRRDNGKKRRYG